MRPSGRDVRRVRCEVCGDTNVYDYIEWQDVDADGQDEGEKHGFCYQHWNKVVVAFQKYQEEVAELHTDIHLRMKAMYKKVMDDDNLAV